MCGTSILYEYAREGRTEKDKGINSIDNVLPDNEKSYESVLTKSMKISRDSEKNIFFMKKITNSVDIALQTTEINDESVLMKNIMADLAEVKSHLKHLIPIVESKGDILTNLESQMGGIKSLIGAKRKKMEDDSISPSMYMPPISHHSPRPLPLHLENFTYTDLLESDTIPSQLMTDISLPTIDSVPVITALPINQYSHTDVTNQENISSSSAFPVSVSNECCFNIPSSPPPPPTSYSDATYQSTPITHTYNKDKKRVNSCSVYIKKELSKVFTSAELANSRYNGGTRRFKNTKVEKIMISPKRLNTILRKAKTIYREDFDEININEVVNGKCRKEDYKLKHKRHDYLHY